MSDSAAPETLLPTRELLEQRVGYLITAYMVDDGKNVSGCERALDEALDAIVAATDLAWAAVAANYHTSGGSIIEKQPLWDALADLEMALRKVGYVA